jgi:hypothetical protein
MADLSCTPAWIREDFSKVEEADVAFAEVLNAPSSTASQYVDIAEIQARIMFLASIC